MTKVSVIIPCYRDASTLAAAIDSVLAQTRQADEIIVVNDSSPESGKIETVLSSYPTVIYISNERNLGLAATRNIGAKLATSDIVSFLDADDQLHPQKLEIQLLVYGSEKPVSCRVHRMARTLSLNELEMYTENFEVRSYSDYRQIQYKNKLVGASIMISRKRFLELGGYNENLRSCEDYDLWFRLIESRYIPTEVQLPLYLYRINPNGLSQDRRMISYWELKAIEAHLKRRDISYLKSFQNAKVWAVWQLRHLYRYEQGPDSEYREFIRKNISKLTEHALMRLCLMIIDRLRLMGFVLRYFSLLGKKKIG